MIIKWIKTEDQLPKEGIEVIGYSKKWIHPDFNKNGTRICFINEGDWHSAKWDNNQDSWHTHAKWCCEFGSDFAPTHWMAIPNPTNS